MNTDRSAGRHRVFDHRDGAESDFFKEIHEI